MRGIMHLMLVQSTSAISNNHCLKLSQCRTFYLVLSAFSWTSHINSSVSRTLLSQTFIMSNNFLSPFSQFWIVSHLLSRTFEWGFWMNHTVNFRNSNVNNCIDKTLFGSLKILLWSQVYWDYKCIKYFTKLISSPRRWKQYTEVFLKIQIIAWRRENNLAFWHVLTENQIQIL